MSFPFPIIVGCNATTETIVATGTLANHTWGNFGSCTPVHGCITDLGDDDFAAGTISIGHDDEICSSQHLYNFEVLLGDPIFAPAGSFCQVMKMVWRRDDTVGTVGGCGDWTCKLLQGTTVIATDTDGEQGSTETRTLTLTDAEVDSITDHTDLRIVIEFLVGLADAEQKFAGTAKIYYLGVDYSEV